MPKVVRGNFSAEFIRPAHRQGDASVIQMFGAGAAPDGYVPKFDAFGNLINSGKHYSAIGASSAPSGAPLALPNVLSTVSATGWSNYTVMLRIFGYSLFYRPASWSVKMRFAGGNPEIDAMVVKRTDAFSTTVLDTTVVTIGGVAAPTLTAPGVVDTDEIAIQLDADHDYYFMIYFPNTNSCAVYQQGVENMRAAYATGDHTGDATIPAFAGANAPYLMLGAFGL